MSGDTGVRVYGLVVQGGGRDYCSLELCWSVCDACGSIFVALVRLVLDPVGELAVFDCFLSFCRAFDRFRPDEACGQSKAELATRRDFMLFVPALT